ncbi:MAG TPA: pseudouridine synthase, partial [Bacteroidota bacterium]|nr:pseudouridine synthase [Bacteroidota bacterium]
KTVYPAGRLDAESEGLLLLTDDRQIAHRLTDPRYGHPRTYLAQVEGVPERTALDALRSGVTIENRITRPSVVRGLVNAPDLPPRPVPIRYRKNVPTTWIEIVITEGRNRQVRKMTAAVGHPTLRLVRTRIGKLSLEGLDPGKWRTLKAAGVSALRRALAGGK